MSTSGKDTAARALVSFVRSYTDLLERQLTACRQTMGEAVDGIMAEITAISQRTSENKEKANTVLLKTYTEPDAEAKKAIDEVQDEVSRIFDEAKKVESDGGFKNVVVQKQGSQGGASSLSRSAGLFSKHMEALDTLDDQLGQHLMQMMGLLSRDDVVAQRLDHVVVSLQALQASLSYLLIDFDNRAQTGDVDRFIRDLKSYVLRTYTMEEEKEVFYQVFPDVRKAS